MRDVYSTSKVVGNSELFIAITYQWYEHVCDIVNFRAKQYYNLFVVNYYDIGSKTAI